LAGGNLESVATLIRLVSAALEVTAVFIIIGGFGLAAADGVRVWRSTRNRHNTYLAVRRVSSRSILFALEVLLAADIIHTTAVEPTVQNMLALGILVVVRTFLSWAIDVDLDGYWPWQRWKLEQETGVAPPVD
jgi:uncharacterized membrane protein